MYALLPGITVERGSLAEMDVEKCVICKETSSASCSECGTPYCSAKCQRLDWNGDHQKVCAGLVEKNCPQTVLISKDGKFLGLVGFDKPQFNIEMIQEDDDEDAEIGTDIAARGRRGVRPRGGRFVPGPRVPRYRYPYRRGYYPWRRQYRRRTFFPWNFIMPFAAWHYLTGPRYPTYPIYAADTYAMERELARLRRENAALLARGDVALVPVPEEGVYRYVQRD